MNIGAWTTVVTAIGTALTPILVAVLGIVITKRQSRNSELLRLRVDYYQQLVPNLNRLMCYVTFIGSWRDDAPPDIVALKRHLDSDFYCAAPLFSRAVSAAYENLMSRSFSTFGAWGSDAKIISSSYRRSQAWCRQDIGWQPGWEQHFTLAPHDHIGVDVLDGYRKAYDELLARLVDDLRISRTRQNYTTARVSLNATSPRPRAID
ncbi:MULTISPECIES: hypothetical protein [unclassified Curtobacterium]|uniref:hypothetical protein n=1 Tax=unclassified Curtobacterium TaxID=257496 RepID=UPI000DA9F3BA|nr:MULTISPECIES: hypothetical protein [unclassified Curtobacterium]WIB64613.1 hypothetical protein DEI94_05340 [Curtobacterium sp. MCBD17_040]WIB68455.1 hypothetical protein DEI93_05310 [Curtobacterium sp. MCBD17_035]